MYLLIAPCSYNSDGNKIVHKFTPSETLRITSVTDSGEKTILYQLLGVASHSGKTIQEGHYKA